MVFDTVSFTIEVVNYVSFSRMQVKLRTGEMKVVTQTDVRNASCSHLSLSLSMQIDKFDTFLFIIEVVNSIF